MELGDRLRDARQKRGFSLRHLGELTGFSASFLSQVELGQSSPSLASLRKITDALGVGLTELLQPAERAPVLRRDQRTALRSEWSKASVQSLVPAGFDETVEAVLLRLDPRGSTGSSRLPPSVRVFAFCTGGAPSMVLGDPAEQMPLEPGDSAMVDGPRHLAWENRGRTPAEILVVTSRVR